MANAELHFTQGASSPGAGFAMIGVTGTPVLVSNGDDSDVENWEFTVVDAGTGSEVTQGVVQDGLSPTYTFTPDVSGCYVLQLETTDDQGNVYLDVRVFGVLETNGLLIPSFTAGAGSMNFVVDDVENEKGWSPFLNAWLKLVAEGGGSAATYSQVCTAGGTIAYSGPSQVPPVVFLTGTPGSSFDYKLPASGYSTVLVNLTTQNVTVSGTTGSGWALLSKNSASFATASNGTATVATSGVNQPGLLDGSLQLGGGDLYLWPSADGPAWAVGAVAGINNLDAGSINYVPMYGPYLGWNDYASFIGEEPVTFGDGLGDGPGASPVAEQVAVVWYAAPGESPDFDSGLLAQGCGGGAFETLVASAYYPGNSWTSQAQGTLVARSGDEIIGTSQSISHFFSLLDTADPPAVYKFTVEMTAKPNAFGSGTMTGTDFSSGETKVTVGTLSNTALECVSATVVQDPADGSSTNLSDMTLVVGVSGNDLVVTVTSSANAGADDTTDFQLKVTAEVE